MNWLRGTILSLGIASTAGWALPSVPPLTADAATHFLGLASEGVSTTSAPWNGADTVFVDYLSGPDADKDRHVVAVYRTPDGSLQSTKVTKGEWEGGDAEVAAMAFANADRDPSEELVVILKWRVAHYDVSGDYFEVRLFDDRRPNEAALAPLEKLTKHFGAGCDCRWRDGTAKHFRFKTVEDVRRELSQLGY